MGAYTDVSDFNNMTFPAYTTIDKQGKAVVDTEESNSGSLGDFLLGDSWDLNKMKERWDKFLQGYVQDYIRKIIWSFCRF